MSATKEYNHDEIERKTRRYDIEELQRMSPADLHDLADSLGIDPEIKTRQGKIAAILSTQ